MIPDPTLGRIDRNVQALLLRDAPPRRAAVRPSWNLLWCALAAYVGALAALWTWRIVQ